MARGTSGSKPSEKESAHSTTGRPPASPGRSARRAHGRRLVPPGGLGPRPGPAERRRGEPRDAARGRPSRRPGARARPSGRTPSTALASRGQPQPVDQPRPARQPARARSGCVGRSRQPVGPVQHLGLVRGHVHARRAVARARLAAQAQVEHLVDLRRAPALRDERAVGHLLQHPGPAPRRVLLVPGGQVRRAHEAARGRGVRPALAHPDAAVHGRGQVTVVVAEREPAAPRQRGARAAGAGRRRAAAGRTSTPGLSTSAGSNRSLTRPEQVDHLRRVHRGEQLAAGPAVAVLAGQRPAVRATSVRGLLEEALGTPATSAGALQRQVEAHVHAAVAEVAVGQAVDAVRRPSAPSNSRR